MLSSNVPLAVTFYEQSWGSFGIAAGSCFASCTRPCPRQTPLPPNVNINKPNQTLLQVNHLKPGPLPPSCPALPQSSQPQPS